MKSYNDIISTVLDIDMKVFFFLLLLSVNSCIIVEKEIIILQIKLCNRPTTKRRSINKWKVEVKIGPLSQCNGCYKVMVYEDSVREVKKTITFFGQWLYNWVDVFVRALNFFHKEAEDFFYYYYYFGGYLNRKKVIFISTWHNIISPQPFHC